MILSYDDASHFLKNRFEDDLTELMERLSVDCRAVKIFEKLTVTDLVNILVKFLEITIVFQQITSGR